MPCMITSLKDCVRNMQSIRKCLLGCPWELQGCLMVQTSWQLSSLHVNFYVLKQSF